MGPVTKPKVVTVNVAVVDHKESFDLTADWPHYDTKICRPSPSGCSAQSELRSKGLWAPLRHEKLSPLPVPVLDREESFDLTANGPVTTPKFVTLPVVVVGREESFDLTDFGPR
ncbi:hypothetical protein L484_001499 [Morus notabilis]|uniref:Uncharacterized protein n=1 Tax=Morus notabilis TaxID=981085 RepID=W9S1K6_9ROSA|nr:hypothetical protein L484_001499 [Morus notabilis]